MTEISESEMQNINDLLDIMRRLRDPQNGCPWDVKQDFSTIAPYTIEEAYEVADAIERGNMDDLREELGDLLLQVVFHAQMAAEKGLFEFSGVVDTLAEKLVRRHPHVFGELTIDSDDELHKLWEEEKFREREQNNTKPIASVLDGVTQALPALMRAEKIQKKVARIGFDWQSLGPVLDKIREEVGEVEQAIESETVVEQEEEIGDLLFAVVNLARHLHIDSETALRKANEKFIARFKMVELVLASREQDFGDTSLDELEAIWQEIKNPV